MAAWPTLKEVRAQLRMVDTADDAQIQTALDAAIDYGMRRLGQIVTVNSDGTVTVDWKYPVDTQILPAAGHEAALIDAAAIYRRRDSIDGTLGFGDAGGVIRVGRFDATVERLYSSLGPLVFG